MSDDRMVIYVHPSGQGDFRAPNCQPIIVGPLYTRIAGMTYFTPGWPTERVKALREPYVYQQRQLPAPSRQKEDA